MKVSKSDKAIKPILTACYPEWKGRKVSLAVCASYQMSDYWSEGSRNFVKAYYLPNGSTAETSPWANIPWDKRATARVQIPAGVALVEHSIFCGKDAGVTIYVGADDLTKLLPSKDAQIRFLKAVAS